MTARTSLGIAALAVALAVTACAPGGPSQPSPDLPLGQASIDWETATITYPLDRYLMSDAEISLMMAADYVVTYECFYGTRELPPKAVAGLLAMTKASMTPQVWMWGRWDAPFVATYTWMGKEPSVVDTGWDAPPGDIADSVRECLNGPARGELTPVSPGYLGLDEAAAPATVAYGEAFARTEAEAVATRAEADRRLALARSILEAAEVL